MANKVRPRCPECQGVMSPIYRKGARGVRFVRIPDAFTCIDCHTLARGRKKVHFL